MENVHKEKLKRESSWYNRYDTKHYISLSDLNLNQSNYVFSSYLESQDTGKHEDYTDWILSGLWTMSRSFFNGQMELSDTCTNERYRISNISDAAIPNRYNQFWIYELKNKLNMSGTDINLFSVFL